MIPSTAAYASDYIMYDVIYISAVVDSTLRAGISHEVVTATLRKHLPFERPPRPKGLTIWQRLAEIGEQNE